MKTQVERFREEVRPYRDEKIVVGEDPMDDISQVWSLRHKTQGQIDRIVRAFFKAWERALKSVARDLRLRNVSGMWTEGQDEDFYRLTKHLYGDPRDGMSLERDLWQMAHDRMTLPAALRTRGRS